MEKVLIFHNYYSQRGGEDSAAEAHFELLKTKGSQFGFLPAYETLNSKDVKSSIQKLKVGFNLRGSAFSRKWIREKLNKHQPSVVHVHNFFPLITPDVFREAKAAQCGTVLTLHNYRLFCANALFFRQNNSCTLCLDHSLWNALKYKCYHQSTFQTLPLVQLIRSGTIKNSKIHPKSWLNHVDRFIVFTPFMKNLYAKAGIPIEKIEIIPNFLPELKFQKPKIEDVDGRQNSRMRLLFVGRISPEKGLDDLLIQFEKFNGQSDISIDIVGDGPLLHTLREKYSKVAGIKWHGQVASAEVQNLMSVCDFLVVPSLWFEGMPLVILEAFRSGLPVIANRIGNLAEIVKEGVNGYLVSPVRTDSVSPLSNDESVQFDWSSLFHFLKEKIGNSSPSAFQKELLELRRNSRNQFDQKYCEKVHLENLSRLYRSISKGLNP